MKTVSLFLFSSVILLTSLLVIESSDAYGVSRNDIKNIKIKIYLAKESIKKIDANVIKQKTIVTEKENILTQKQTTLKELRAESDPSFTYQKEILNAEKAIETAEKTLKDANRKHLDYLDEKSFEQNKIDSLELVLIESKKALKSQGVKNNLIGITLSNTCITLIKNNIDSTCPTYEFLSQIDSSNVNVSGDFVYDESNFLHRGTPQLQNSHQWYKFDNSTRLIVDPPSGYNISTIIIQPNFDTYISRESNIITDTFSRTLYHDRYIDNCKDAKINSDKWMELLPDTIYHMRQGCTENSTNFIEEEIIFNTFIELDISQTASYQYNQWLESSKELCKEKC